MASGIKGAGLLQVTAAITPKSPSSPPPGSQDSDFKSQLQQKESQRASAHAQPDASSNQTPQPDKSTKTSHNSPDPADETHNDNSKSQPADASAKTSQSNPSDASSVSDTEDKPSPDDKKQPASTDAKTNPDIPPQTPVAPAAAVTPPPANPTPAAATADASSEDEPAPAHPAKTTSLALSRQPANIQPAQPQATANTPSQANTQTPNRPAAQTASAPADPAQAQKATKTAQLPQPNALALQQNPAATADNASPKQQAAQNPSHQPAQAVAQAQTDNALAQTTSPSADAPAQDAKSDHALSLDPAAKAFDTLLQSASPKTQASPTQTSAPSAPLPDSRFVDNNHPNIISNIRSQLLPNGGSMNIRLDPPELGAMQVTVHMRDGVMTASFETSNDQATRLLSHSLDQLKSVLEAQGVQVDKMQVRQQSPSDFRQQGDNTRQQQQQHAQDNPARQQQQRRELMQRMWAKLALGDEPLDITG